MTEIPIPLNKPIPENECIWILYKSLKSPEPRWRKIYPRDISFRMTPDSPATPVWYLNAYDVDKGSFRSYQLTRIEGFHEIV